MVKNPYLNRAAIRDVLCFTGRRREVSRIFSRLGAARPQSVSVVGERRMGKSSLLNYVASPEVRRKFLEAPDRYVFVKMDFQERRNISLKEFFRELILNVMGEADFSSTLTPDFEGVRSAVSSLQRKGLKLVALFDEFDIVTSNSAFGEDFFSFFRSLANNFDLAYVTSSRRDLQELCHTTRVADSPFFNIFSTLNLGVFSREEALQLVSGPSAAAGVPLAAHADQILDVAGLFPFFLQIACGAWFEHLSMDGAGADESQVRESFRQEVYPHFNYLWDLFTPDERDVFHLLNRGEAIPPRMVHVQKKLEREGYVRPLSGGLFSSVFRDFTVEKSHGDPSPGAGKTSPGIGETVLVSGQRKSGGEQRAVVDVRGLRRLGSFDILGKLGEGGMGVVFNAVDAQLKRPVALKVLSPRIANDAVMRKRFLKEAQSAAVLNHPNICTIHQVGQEGGVDFIVMELVEGQTLKDMIRTSAFKPRGLAKIGLQIADALDHAHSMKMIHRDIKPANIMVMPNGRVKVLDFGLVKWQGGEDIQKTAASNLTAHGAIMGTVNFMSPEQLKGEELDCRTDIFSLGMVLHEMATGRAPFSGENYISVMHAILYEPPGPLPPAFPEELRMAVLMAMEKRPGDRYQSVAGLRRDLAAFLKHNPGP